MISLRAALAVAKSKLRLVARTTPVPKAPVQLVVESPRFYSTTLPVYKKKDDDDEGDELDIFGDLTPEQAQKIVEEEVLKLQDLEDDKYLVKPEDWKPGMRKRKLVVGRDLEEFY